jgi:hypothetical protein
MKVTKDEAKSILQGDEVTEEDGLLLIHSKDKEYRVDPETGIIMGERTHAKSKIVKKRKEGRVTKRH